MAKATRNYKEVEKVIKEKVKDDTITLVLTQKEVDALYKVTGLVGGSPSGNRGYIQSIRDTLSTHVESLNIDGTGTITLY